MNEKKCTAVLHAPYFMHKDVDVAEELLYWARSEDRNLGVNSLLLLFPLAHPEKAPEWNRRFSHYIRRATRLFAEATSDHIGWNDYWMARWLILGEDSTLAKLHQQTKRTTIWAPPGHSPRPDSQSVGDFAIWMTDSMAMQVPEFEKRWHSYLKEADPDLYNSSPTRRDSSTEDENRYFSSVQRDI